MQITVGIATANRRDQLTLTICQLQRLSPLPCRVVISVASRRDVDEAVMTTDKFPVTIVDSIRGLCAQRNAILRQTRDADVVAFFDDDFYPAPDYLAHVREIFTRHPEVVVATGHPELDGALGPGISHDVAARECTRMTGPLAGSYGLKTTYGAYGCNMLVRMTTLRDHGVFFDEELPLYGWLEDLEFSRRAARFGRIVACSRLRGVHLGVKQGRQREHKLGYSQIANPWYMAKKGSIHTRVALRYMSRNVLKNIFRSLWPEPWVDRRGRVVGNAIAAADLLRGRLHPGHILELT